MESRHGMFDGQGHMVFDLRPEDHFWKPTHPMLETSGMASSNCTNAERGTAKVATAHCF